MLFLRRFLFILSGALFIAAPLLVTVDMGPGACLQGPITVRQGTEVIAEVHEGATVGCDTRPRHFRVAVPSQLRQRSN